MCSIFCDMTSRKRNYPAQNYVTNARKRPLMWKVALEKGQKRDLTYRHRYVAVRSFLLRKRKWKRASIYLYGHFPEEKDCQRCKNQRRKKAQLHFFLFLRKMSRKKRKVYFCGLEMWCTRLLMWHAS